MCLIFLAIDSHPRYPLVLAGNRDEDYDRPTAAAAFWDEAPHLLAGRDLRAGGTWLGITRQGRIAAITNFRQPALKKSDAPTRGTLVSDFLLGQESAERYLGLVEGKADAYNGFNLLVGEKNRIYWYSNRGGRRCLLSPGQYGISNHLLDTPWPKVTRVKEAMRGLLAREENPDPEEIFNILRDRYIPDDDSLPDTRIGLERERLLSPIFISSPGYGTRSSSILLIDRQDHVLFMERTYNAAPDHASTVEFKFRIGP